MPSSSVAWHMRRPGAAPFTTPNANTDDEQPPSARLASPEQVPTHAHTPRPHLALVQRQLAAVPLAAPVARPAVGAVGAARGQAGVLGRCAGQAAAEHGHLRGEQLQQQQQGQAQGQLAALGCCTSWPLAQSRGWALDGSQRGSSGRGVRLRRAWAAPGQHGSGTKARQYLAPHLRPPGSRVGRCPCRALQVLQRGSSNCRRRCRCCHCRLGPLLHGLARAVRLQLRPALYRVEGLVELQQLVEQHRAQLRVVGQSASGRRGLMRLLHLREARVGRGGARPLSRRRTGMQGRGAARESAPPPHTHTPTPTKAPRSSSSWADSSALRSPGTQGCRQPSPAL
jgi:hypothetical protein